MKKKRDYVDQSTDHVCKQIRSELPNVQFENTESKLDSTCLLLEKNVGLPVAR